MGSGADIVGRPRLQSLQIPILALVLSPLLAFSALGAEKVRVWIPPRAAGGAYTGQSSASTSGFDSRRAGVFPHQSASSPDPRISPAPAQSVGTFADVDTTTALGAVLMVTTTADTGEGSFRKALQDANDSPGRDSIVFAIGSGWIALNPLSPLPLCFGPIVIDATTQPGYSGVPLIELQGTFLPDGLTLLGGSSVIRGLVINACQGVGILITGPGNNVIEGCYVGTGPSGTRPVSNGGYGIHVLDSPFNRIGGSAPGARNVVSGNYWPEITIEGPGSTGNVIQGNYIGVKSDGLAAVTDSCWNGIFIRRGASQTLIGGTNPGEGNVISGFPEPAIGVNASFETLVYGNIIGTNKDITALVSRGNGMRITAGSSGTQVGDGTSAGMNYVMAGVNWTAIMIDTDDDPSVTSFTSGNVVRGNSIGAGRYSYSFWNFAGIGISNSPGNIIGDTLLSGGNRISYSTFAAVNISGDTSRSNRVWGNRIVDNGGMGVRIYNSPENLIGGPQEYGGNVIDRNGSHGIRITGNSPGTIVQRNRIGTDTDPLYANNRGNRGHGILCVSSGITIGGDTTLLGNLIGNNALAGVFDSSGAGNRISHNSIFNNAAYGIALGKVGLSVNDSLDADSGPNGLQNFPILDSIAFRAGVTRIRGRLESAPSVTYSIEFYSSAARHASRFGEGETVLGTVQVTTDASGRADLTAELPIDVDPLHFITATATDPAGNTSQFSRALSMADADGDGLLDIWETRDDGIDVNSDNIIDLDLFARGARPDHKDLFVEVDWMETRKPLPGVLAKVAEAFHRVPTAVLGNPDGMPGINLHIDTVAADPEIPVTAWGFDPWPAFYAAKQSHFGTRADSANPNFARMLEARRLVYRYCIFADTYDTTGSSGLANGIPSKDFFVSLGAFPTPGGTADEQQGTFMHELGHTLGLGHGGVATSNDNFKPNYYSVMNYLWQFPRGGVNGWKLDYSRSELPLLNEADLVESDGLNPGHLPYPTLKIPYRRTDRSLSLARLTTANNAVDWDGDGDSTGRASGPETIHYLNANLPVGPPVGLAGHSDWQNLVYNFRELPDFRLRPGPMPQQTSAFPAAEVQAVLSDEMTLSERLRILELPPYGIEEPLGEWSGDAGDATPLDLRFSSQGDPAAISDGSGGALITWHSSQGRFGRTSVYLQRMDSLGGVVWQSNGIEVPGRDFGASNPMIAPDGDGGALISWIDRREIFTIPRAPVNVYLQRVNNIGHVMWGAGGVRLSAVVSDTAGTLHQILSDGAKGAIVVWREYRSGSLSLFAQRVNPAGVPQWTAGGVLLTPTASTIQDYNFRMISDDSSGAIVVWEDRRAITPGDPANSDLYAQRIDAAGKLRWNPTGVPVCTAPVQQLQQAIASDGAGGVITAWQDFRGTRWEIYAQRVNTAGVAQWTADGVPVRTGTGSRTNPVVVGDSAGGAIIAWNEPQPSLGVPIYAQRIDSSGILHWPAGGVLVSDVTRSSTPPTIIPDMRHGALVGYVASVGNDINNTNGLYVQRIDSSGARRWGGGGAKFFAPGSYKMGMVADKSGGVILAFLSPKPGETSGSHLFAQKVNAGGGLGDANLTDVAGSSEEIPASFAVLQNYPNPFNPSTTIAFMVERPAEVSIVLFDVLGRRVRTVTEGRYGTGRFTSVWDGKNDAGTSVATGVYFMAMRVGEGNGAASTLVGVKKLMLVR